MIRPGQSPETVFGENNNLPFASVGKWLITVSEESKALFTKGITQINKKVTQCTRIAVDTFNPIEIMRAE